MTTQAEIDAAYEAYLKAKPLSPHEDEWVEAALKAGERARWQPIDEVAAAREKNERNARVAARYDELRAEGKHGHYETMFRVVREEVEATERVHLPLQAQIDAAITRVNRLTIHVENHFKGKRTCLVSEWLTPEVVEMIVKAALEGAESGR